MLFLFFHIGDDRYAVEASRVVEVLPMVSLKKLPHAPRGVAGLFSYRGAPVPAVDLAELAVGRAAAEALSTRIIVVQHPAGNGAMRCLGLIAERATEIARKDPREFVHSGITNSGAPYLGPVLMDPRGPVQWIHEQRLLPPPLRELIFSPSLLASHASD